MTIDDGEEHQEYEYEEAVIGWALPGAYASLVEVETYLSSVQDEILRFAQATQANLWP